jgi:DNA-binding MarR family transcriptional regulator
MSTDDPIDFGVLLNLAFGSFKNQLHDHLAQHGFDDIGPMFGYVFRFLRAEPHSLKELADWLGMTPQGALKIVDDMVAKDYVERQAHTDDGRVKYLVLTARARAAMKQAQRFHMKFERDLGQQLGPGAALTARTVLEAIVADAGEEEPPRLRPR